MASTHPVPAPDKPETAQTCRVPVFWPLNKPKRISLEENNKALETSFKFPQGRFGVLHRKVHL